MVVHATTSKEYAISVLSELLEKRDACQGSLDAMLASLRVKDEESGEERDRELTPEEEQRSQELLAERDDLDARIEEETGKARKQSMLAEARKHAVPHVETRSGAAEVDVSVTSERPVYGVGAEHSWFHDRYLLATQSPIDSPYQAALARQFEWSHQVERLIDTDPKFAKYAEKQFREHYRVKGDSARDWVGHFTEARSRGRYSLSDKGLPEVRALTTGGGATASAAGGGTAAFVTPIFTDEYVPFREFGRAFADAVTNRPLPDYGMAIYMPQITGAAAVSTSYAEGSGVTETDPTQGYITAALVIIAGQVTTSQAILDRTGPNFEYDVVIWDQLQRDYAQKWDSYVLTQALANATSQTYNGTFKVTATTLPGTGGLYGQVSQAKSTMRTTVGTVLNPSHLFAVPARWEFVAGYADTQGRPIVVPDYAGPYNAAAGGSSDGDVGVEGRTGYRFNGLPVFTDQNIPTTGGTANQDQVLVLDASQVWAYEGAPVHRVLPQTLGGNLNVIFQQYSYGTVLVRYNAGVVKINGTALAQGAGLNFNG